MLCVMTVSHEQEQGWVASDRDSFGARLALVRQRMGWGNVKEAALACGIPPQSWRTWERDNVQPRDFMAVVRKVVARAGCDEAWLAGVGLVPAEVIETSTFCSEVNTPRTLTRPGVVPLHDTPRRAA